MTQGHHNGSTKRILEALEREPQISVYKIHLATGIDTVAIRRLLRQAMRGGGVVELDGPHIKVYCLYRHAPKKERKPKEPGPYAMAERITIPQYRYGSGRF